MKKPRIDYDEYGAIYYKTKLPELKKYFIIRIPDSPGATLCEVSEFDPILMNLELSGKVDEPQPDCNYNEKHKDVWERYLVFVVQKPRDCRKTFTEHQQ